MVRDLVAQHPDVDKVEFDVNYIWRTGSEGLPSDEIPVGSFTSRIGDRIAGSIARSCGDAPVLIEKTVSNCLRIDFVRSVFPEARFIHLVRNGEDVIESAYRQWLAGPDFRYILKKTATFPLLDAFGYALSYARNTVRRLLPSQEKTPIIWGPHYKGIEQDLERIDLLEVCAIQWLKCLQEATIGLVRIPQERVLWIRYEDFVRDPESHLKRVAMHICVDPSCFESLGLRGLVDGSNVGKGQRNLAANQLDLIRPYVLEGERLLARPSIARRFTGL